MTIESHKNSLYAIFFLRCNFNKWFSSSWYSKMTAPKLYTNEYLFKMSWIPKVIKLNFTYSQFGGIIDSARPEITP